MHRADRVCVGGEPVHAPAPRARRGCPGWRVDAGRSIRWYGERRVCLLAQWPDDSVAARSRDEPRCRSLAPAKRTMYLRWYMYWACGGFLPNGGDDSDAYCWRIKGEVSFESMQKTGDKALLHLYIQSAHAGARAFCSLFHCKCGRPHKSH